MTRTSIRGALTLALAVLLPISAAAQTADPTLRYAVVSLMGDKLTMVRARQQVASNANRNDTQVFETSDATLDNMAVLAVDDELRRQTPQIKATLMSIRDPKLFTSQDAMASDAGDSAALFAALKERLAKSNATRLILVSKWRTEARMQMDTNLVGVGRLMGLGFYIDEDMYVIDRSSGVENQGFVAPYAYLMFTLIDLPTMTVIKRSFVPQSLVVPTSVSKAATKPWDAMTPKQKLDGLEQTIRQAVGRGMPDLLAAK